MPKTTMTAELHDELKFAVRATVCPVGCPYGCDTFADNDSKCPDCCEEPPCCSICDGIGHGYPGAGPCPLENTMSAVDVDREEWEATYLS